MGFTALPSGSDDTLIELSPLTFAVQDDKSFGVPPAIAHASIHAFHPNDHAGGMQCAWCGQRHSHECYERSWRGADPPAARSGRLLTRELIVRVTSMGLERFASVRLYTPSPAPSAATP